MKETKEEFRPFAESPPYEPAPLRDVAPTVTPSQPTCLPAPTKFPVEPESLAAPIAPPTSTPPPAPAPTAAPTAASSQRAILVLSILLTAAVCLVTGYILGMRSDWIVARTPFPVLEPPVPPATQIPPTEAAKPPPELVLIQPRETTPDPPPQPAPMKASAAAESALKAFLDADDWTTRSAYVLYPEKIRPAMEAYSRERPDGPTAWQSINLKSSFTDEDTGYTLFVYQVVTEDHPEGIPVAVAETASGWLVDWQTFTEFRDDLFKAFADGPADQSGRFHLIVTIPPAPRAENTENEHFASFLLAPPIPGRQQIAYVRKASELHTRLNQVPEEGEPLVLEITKRNTPDNKSYLEITALVATNWLPTDP